MIPISDEGVRRHRFPFVNILLVALNAVVFIYEITLDDRELMRFVTAYGVVPVELTTGRDLPPVGFGEPWMNMFSSMFIHGGWIHFGSNMLYLWVFGDNVEDTFTHLGYLPFYLLAGVAAALAQTYADPASATPAIGASGAIAGVLGAYLVLHPTARVNTLLIFGIFIHIRPLPAVLVLGFWGLMQIFSGVASIGAPVGVAYWAHVGGFITGIIIALPLIGRARRRQRFRYLE